MLVQIVAYLRDTTSALVHGIKVLNHYHTRNYALFKYKPPLLLAKICCGDIFISNLSPPGHLLLDEIFHLTSNLHYGLPEPGCLQIDPYARVP